MRATLPGCDSGLIAKVTVVARALAEISERNVMSRQLEMIRCHAGRRVHPKKKEKKDVRMEQAIFNFGSLVGQE